MEAVSNRSRALGLAAAGLFAGGLIVMSQGREPLGARFTALLMVVTDATLLMVLWWAAAAGWGAAIGMVTRRYKDGGGAELGSVELAVVGGAVMTLAMWLAGWAGALNAGVAWGLAAAGWVSLMIRLRRLADASPAWPTLPTTSLLAAPAAGLLVGATAYAPGGLWDSEFGGYDVLAYHLQLPREWIARSAITGLEHNVYSYLPNLWETAYAQIALWKGGVLPSVYAAQLLHATMAVAAAVIIGRLVARFTTAGLGGIAAAIYIATPWTLVTGSLAYNEQAMIALGAAALSWTLGLVTPSPSQGEGRGEGESRGDFTRCGMIGLACGLAVMCKLTAAGFFALPIGLLLVADRRGGKSAWVRRTAALAVGFTLVFGLFLIRNALWTGNPVFPMFAEHLGLGHWTADQAQRWSASVGAPSVISGLVEIGPAILAHRQFAWVLFPTAVVGGIIGVLRPATRRLALVLIVLIAVQLLFWLFFTHHKSRFAVPLLVPAVMLIALGLAPLRAMQAAAVGAVLVIVATGVSLAVYYDEPVTTVYYIDGVEIVAEPGLSAPNVFNSINALPPGARVYAEGFATPLYVGKPITYHTVWDASPLGEPLQMRGVSGAVAWLRQRGYTHVLIDFVMLERWHRPGNYGYDQRITPEAIGALARVLRPAARFRGQMLLAVP